MFRATFVYLSVFPAGSLTVDIGKGEVVGTDLTTQGCHFSIEPSLAEAAGEDQPDQAKRGHAGTRSPRVVTTGIIPAQ